MCNKIQGKELMKIFAKYYSGRHVDESDSDILDTLSVTGYLEYYIQDGEIYARAGSIGKLFRKPNPRLFA